MILLYVFKKNKLANNCETLTLYGYNLTTKNLVSVYDVHLFKLVIFALKKHLIAYNDWTYRKKVETK